MSDLRQSRVTGLVLAAGTSSRLGRPKQLLELAGKPVLQHVLDTAGRCGLDELLLVLGHDARRIQEAITLPPGIRVVLNPDYRSGQSTSMVAGLRAADPTSEAVIVLLGDQPGVRVEVIRAVLGEWRGGRGPVVQAAYGGRPAHPVLIARSVWPKLLVVAGDEGARGIFDSHPEWLALVEVGGAPPYDIDTEEDYDRARAAFGSP